MIRALSRQLLRGRRHASRWMRAEEGAVTAEFVIVFPFIVMLFLMTLEASVVQLRIVMTDRALDLVVRELRLGRLGEESSPELVRQTLCARAMLIPNCERDMTLEMRVIDRSTWTGFERPPACINRVTQIRPPVDFTQGGINEVVTIRACSIFDPIFPSTYFGLSLPRDGSGGYQIAATSAFVNEP